MTIFGWDMSHYDAPNIGNAVAEGISFITHKAGGDSDDPELGAWWAGVRGLDPGRVLLGAYWVLRPPVDAAGEASAFLRRLDADCPGWRVRPFLLQLDCEKWNGDPSTVPSKAQIGAVCGQLVKAAPNLRPVVYAPKWVYGDSLTGLGYPLWASSYVTGAGSFRALYPGDGSSKWAPYSGQTPAILQYSSSATIGGQSTSDANAFRGTLAQLTALVAPGWVEEDFMVALTDQQQQDLAYEVKRCWWMVRNIESLVTALASGNSSRPVWPDKETGYTYPAVPMFPNVSLGQLLADHVSDADLKAALEQLPTADDNARAVLAALAAGSPQQVAAALKVVLGDQAAAVGALLAAA